MAPVVAFTIKPRVMDLGESKVYHELLCFSQTTPRHNWYTCTEEEVRVSKITPCIVIFYVLLLVYSSIFRRNSCY